MDEEVREEIVNMAGGVGVNMSETGYRIIKELKK